MLPVISVIIPTFNEEKNIDNCLKSIFSQNYPKSKLEVIVVDDLSTDRTIKIAKRYPIKVLTSGKRHGEISKMVGFKAAKGELAVYIDADIELGGKNWFQKMIEPLMDDKEIVGSFTRYYSKKDTPGIERYLNFDALQRDSIYQYFSSSIDSVITVERNDYFICEYSLGKIPPAGLCVYRKDKLLKIVNNYDMFLELDFLVLLVKNGLRKFAYVPNSGLYHHHVASLSELLRKRKYNLTKVYLAREDRLYKWFDVKKDFLKIVIWIIYANLIIPSVFVGIYKTIKYKDFAGMYEPVVNFFVTNQIIINFLLDQRGRKILNEV